MPDPGAHPPAACSEPSACPQSCRAAGEEISGSVSRTEYYSKNWYSTWPLAILNKVSYPVCFCSEFTVFFTQKVAFTFKLLLQSTHGLVHLGLPVCIEIVLELVIDMRVFNGWRQCCIKIYIVIFFSQLKTLIFKWMVGVLKIVCKMFKHTVSHECECSASVHGSFQWATCKCFTQMASQAWFTLSPCCICLQHALKKKNQALYV